MKREYVGQDQAFAVAVQSWQCFIGDTTGVPHESLQRDSRVCTDCAEYRLIKGGHALSTTGKKYRWICRECKAQRKGRNVAHRD